MAVAIMAAAAVRAQQLPGAAPTEEVAVNAAPKYLLPPVISAGKSTVEEYTSCSVSDLQAASTLTLAQRGCLYRSRLLSKSFPVRAAMFAAISEWRKSDIKNPGLEDFTHRFETYYARRTAQSTGEFLAGYLNHEDPRYRPSLEHGVWKRSRAALQSVMVARDLDGNGRVALAPIAGAFGSGLVTVACYRTRNSLDDGFRRSAVSYGFYFGTALFREFRPELTGLTSRFSRRR